MHKKLIFFLLLGLIFSALPNFVHAATTFNFNPVKVDVKEGEVFSLDVYVDPAGASNYTIKTDIKFPSELVSLKDWKYANSWMALKKTGYDYFNNTTGQLIRTAGYPEGFKEKTLFGTASFIAKKSGEATIYFAAKNLALNENSANVYEGGDEVVVTVLAGEPPTETQLQTSLENPPGSEENIPEQLFDINLVLDQTKLDKIEDLNARVVFMSFGTQPTPTDMTFDILDKDGNIVYAEKGNIVVLTEAIYKKNFSGFSLMPGKYTLRLTTLYNGNVKDEFKQDFEIVSKSKITRLKNMLSACVVYKIAGICCYWWLLVLLAVIVGIVLISKNKKQNKKRYR